MNTFFSQSKNNSDWCTHIRPHNSLIISTSGVMKVKGHHTVASPGTCRHVSQMATCKNTSTLSAVSFLHAKSCSVAQQRRKMLDEAWKTTVHTLNATQRQSFLSLHRNTIHAAMSRLHSQPRRIQIHAAPLTSGEKSTANHCTRTEVSN